MSTYLLFLAVARLLIFPSNAQSCYLPGGEKDTVSISCRPGAAGSHCCAAGEFCLDNGLCLSNTTSISVGGCTDSTWDHPACFQGCKKAFSQSRLTPVENNSTLFCCTAYETVNGQSCVDVHDGSSRPAFAIPPFTKVMAGHTNRIAADQEPLLIRRDPTCSPAPNSGMATTANPVIVGVSTGIPLGGVLFITFIFLVKQRRELLCARRTLSKAQAKSESGRAYFVLPNQRAVSGRGIFRASKSIVEVKCEAYEIDGRELKGDQRPLPPLPKVSLEEKTEEV